MNSETRNMIVVGAVLAVLFMAYQIFIVTPATKHAEAAHKQAVAAQTQTAATPSGPTFVSRDQALALSPRIAIRTGTLQGSIALTGARFDDLLLSQYPVSLEKGAPAVELLRPSGSQFAYFVVLGWQGANIPGMPNSNSVWTQTSGGALAPGRPVGLRYVSPAGLTFDRTIAVDDKYMFTITDKVTNAGSAPVAITPNGVVQRDDVPPTLGKNNIVHEGGLGVLNGSLKEEKYGKWKKDGDKSFEPATGWFGITDKYWMAVMIPPSAERFNGDFTMESQGGVDRYAARVFGAAPITIPAGQAISYSTRMFAGPKVRNLLNHYPDVTHFQDAIDWGFAWVITKPIHWLLEFFYGYVHNYGVAILMLTVVIRLIMFPLANRGYEMSVKMKKLAPMQKELQERFKDDPQAYQKEYMALLQREKLNPVTGCLPLFLQIPVFYSLTKVFTVSIDLRQANFMWVHDLSAQDPTSIFNLFGLIPWDIFHTPWVSEAMGLPVIGGIVAMVLHLGVWPIAYGFSMFVSQAMTPQQGIDPTQQMIFKLMPIIFTFILSQYAVGLLIYWTWSGAITVLQTYVLMRRFKVDNPIDEFIRRITGRPKDPELA